MKTKLYLHMGPGFHSEIAKKKYGDIEAVDFWNQPPCGNFDELVSAANEKTAALAKAASQPISLIAHSFGGQLARMIQQSQPENVKEIILVNSALDPFECFINLAPYVNPENSKMDFDSIRKAPVQEKVDFILGLASTPGFNDLYWHSKDKMNALAPLFAEAPQLDIGVFLKVFPDFLAKKDQLFKTSSWKGPVRIYHSVYDLLLSKSKDVDSWSQVFPQAEFIRRSDSGHYLLLEDATVAKEIFS